MPTKNVQLKHCAACNQMTNHIGDKCLKCEIRMEEAIASAELAGAAKNVQMNSDENKSGGSGKGLIEHEGRITIPHTTDEEILKEFEKQFIEIVGLETDPNGCPNMYLIRDQDDVIQHGIDFDEEREKLKDWLRSALSQARKDADEKARKDEREKRDGEWIDILKKAHSSVLSQLKGEIALRRKLLSLTGLNENGTGSSGRYNQNIKGSTGSSGNGTK